MPLPPPIYLDHHATTPCDPRVVERMLPYFSEQFGNPSSITHGHGRAASLAIEEARRTVAKFFGFLPPEVYFTASATEANNMAIELAGAGDHLITTAVEHKSVLRPVERARQRGVEVTILQPSSDGRIDPETLRDAVRTNTRLVSIEGANGEIGTIQPIEQLSAITRERGIAFHTDFTQAAGKVAVDLAAVDLVSLSAHKFYGPKGAGALLMRRGIRLPPLLVGGGQERGIRAGTINVPAVVGLGAALALRAAEMSEEAERLTLLREDLCAGLLDRIDDISINGPRELRLPGNLNVTFGRVDAESVILAMKHFSLSSGSACSSGERGPSTVLKAIGLSDAAAMGSIRFGLGKANTAEQISMLVDDLSRVMRRLREISPK